MEPQSPSGVPATSSIPEGATAPPPGGWTVASGHGATWWREGWRLFAAFPVVWIAMTVLFVVLMFVLALVPILGHVASTVLYPVLVGGLLVGARAVDRAKR